MLVCLQKSSPFSITDNFAFVEKYRHVASLSPSSAFAHGYGPIRKAPLPPVLPICVVLLLLYILLHFRYFFRHFQNVYIVHHWHLIIFSYSVHFNVAPFFKAGSWRSLLTLESTPHLLGPHPGTGTFGQFCL